jgi:gluconokinase
VPATGSSPPPPALAVVVMGVSGSGKSTVGPLLARALHCAFLEGDGFHDAAAVAKMSAGHPLTDEDRWPWLDRLGASLKAELAAGGAAVAACSALKRAYRERIDRAVGGGAAFVLLDVDRGELGRRLVERPGHFMPPALLDSQLQTLERPSSDERAVVLPAGASPADLCDAALRWLRSLPTSSEATATA